MIGEYMHQISETTVGMSMSALAGKGQNPANNANEGSAPYLDLLQEAMEAVALGEKANHGRYCGNCYGALGGPTGRRTSQLAASECEFCGQSTAATSAAVSVPAEVLSIYMAKRKREGLIVNFFAFVGIFLSLVLSALLWFLLPDNWWKVLPFVVLAFGSYYLARVIGYNVGVPVGSKSGRKLRDRQWQTFVHSRTSARAGSTTDLPE
jgi:hypothetical protein